MSVRKSWQCRHGVDLTVASIECEGCAMSAEPRSEELVVAVASMLASHITGVATAAEQGKPGRELLGDMLVWCQVATVHVSQVVAASDAPPCPMEFRIREALRVQSAPAIADDKAVRLVTEQIIAAAIECRKWVGRVQTWARVRCGE